MANTKKTVLGGNNSSVFKVFLIGSNISSRNIRLTGLKVIRKQKNINLIRFDADRLLVKVYSAPFFRIVLLGVLTLNCSLAYARSAKKPIKKTDSRNVTTKLGSQSDSSGVLINRETGKKVTVQQALDASTEAGYKYTGGVSPAGLYYTPGPPIYTPALTPSTSGAVTTNEPLMQAQTFGGAMWLLQKGGSLLQPLAGRLGSPVTEQECEDCAKKSSEIGIPNADPNLQSAEEKLIDESEPLAEHVDQASVAMDLEPFKYADGSINREYREYLNVASHEDPFSEIFSDAAEELSELCPNYENMPIKNQVALVDYMFSLMMRPDGRYNEKRVVTATVNGTETKSYGLCSISVDQAQFLIRKYNAKFEINKGEDLFDPEKNIRLCVMELHEHIDVAKRENKPVRPFQSMNVDFRNAELKKKISNIPVCKKQTDLVS